MWRRWQGPLLAVAARHSQGILDANNLYLLEPYHRAGAFQRISAGLKRDPSSLVTILTRVIDLKNCLIGCRSTILYYIDEISPYKPIFLVTK